MSKYKKDDLCISCKKRNVRIKGRLKNKNFIYGKECNSCHTKRYKFINKNFSYRIFKKNYCENCKFIPIHSCQLDVDHIDGDHKNNDPSNIMTLCANCHRLKTYLSKDGMYKKGWN